LHTCQQKNEAYKYGTDHSTAKLRAAFETAYRYFVISEREQKSAEGQKLLPLCSLLVLQYF